MTAETSPSRRDLIVLAADLDTKLVVSRLLSRRATDLGMRAITFEVERHTGRDPACRLRSAEFLREYAARFDHALVVFDHHGSGAAERPARDVERRVEQELGRNGWPDRARCVVIEPELEVWLRNESDAMSETLRWTGAGVGGVTLREWAHDSGRWPPDRPKPSDPKEAIRKACELARTRYSASVVADLAGPTPLDGCTDRAFLRLRHTLRTWFPMSR